MAQINILHPVYRTQYTTSIYILYLLVSILALFCYRFSFLLFCLSSASLGPPEGLENPTVSKRDRKKIYNIIHWVWCTSIGKDFSKFRSIRNGFLTAACFLLAQVHPHIRFFRIGNRSHFHALPPKRSLMLRSFVVITDLQPNFSSAYRHLQPNLSSGKRHTNTIFSRLE